MSGPSCPFAERLLRVRVISHPILYPEVIMIWRQAFHVGKFVLILLIAVVGGMQVIVSVPGYAAERSKKPGVALSPGVSAALQYAEAVSSGDRASVGRLDFGCLYRLVSSGKPVRTLPPPT